jgi:hypothetical protein
MKDNSRNHRELLSFITTAAELNFTEKRSKAGLAARHAAVDISAVFHYNIFNIYLDKERRRAR